MFQVAGTFPIRPLRQDVYKVPGDSMWGFDPNAFVQKLIEETGFSHSWKPVLASVPEGTVVVSVCKTRPVFVQSDDLSRDPVVILPSRASRRHRASRLIVLVARHKQALLWYALYVHTGRRFGRDFLGPPLKGGLPFYSVGRPRVFPSSSLSGNCRLRDRLESM